MFVCFRRFPAFCTNSTGCGGDVGCGIEGLGCVVSEAPLVMLPYFCVIQVCVPVAWMPRLPMACPRHAPVVLY